MAEDNAGLPGWVDERLDELFSRFPDDLGIEPHRLAYAECLARAATPASSEAAQAEDRAACRAQLINGLETAGVAKPVLQALDDVLEALEDELSGDA